MKIKSLILASSVIFATLNSVASTDECYGYEMMGLGFIGTVTLAPSGTMFLTSMTLAGCYGRDLILNIKEDAVAYRLNGEASPLLEKVIAETQKLNPGMSEDEIVNGLVNLQQF